MSRIPQIIALAGVAAFVGHEISTRTGSSETRPRESRFAAMRNRMMKRMLASMPDDSPPKLIMSVLPRLQAQNERILALLEEQNELLRGLSTGQEGKPDA
jgi:hypothetical protein